MATKKQKSEAEAEEPAEDLTQPGITEPVSPVDIPAQIEEPKESHVQIMQDVPLSEEILFLNRILNIQRVGGFGRHLDDMIHERIKELKKK